MLLRLVLRVSFVLAYLVLVTGKDGNIVFPTIPDEHNDTVVMGRGVSNVLREHGERVADEDVVLIAICSERNHDRGVEGNVADTTSGIGCVGVGTTAQASLSGASGRGNCTVEEQSAVGIRHREVASGPAVGGNIKSGHGGRRTEREQSWPRWP